MTDAPSPRCSSGTIDAVAAAIMNAFVKKWFLGSYKGPVYFDCVNGEKAWYEEANAAIAILGAAQPPTKPGPDDRRIPIYGQIPWEQLGRDVMDAIYAKRSDYPFDKSYYPGHQMVPQINFNSLARIVDKYRYYGASPVSSTDREAGK